jgi:hypothetical protein
VFVRRYEIDGENFKWSNNDAAEKDSADVRGSIPISSITEIRFYTNDPNLQRECAHAFEFDTPGRTFALGCENATDKDNWVTALNVARDAAVAKKSAGHMKTHAHSHSGISSWDLNTMDAHVDNLVKQETVFLSLVAEDRQSVVTAAGIDTSDAHQMLGFLYSEMLAAGTLPELALVLQQLLLIPPGDTAKLTKICTGDCAHIFIAITTPQAQNFVQC